MIPMFKKLPIIGTLYLEKTLYCRMTPEIFVCVDDGGYRYLCVATSKPGQWLIGRMKDSILLQVLEDRRPMYNAIRGCSLKGIVTGITGRYSFSADVPAELWSNDRLLGLYSFDEGVQEYCRELS